MRTAVVIGGGVGGLVCARVLSDRFDRVEVIERGRYPEQPEARKHVPQGQQVHILLAEGYRLFQGWFPDFGERMDALGIREVDFGTDSVQYLGASKMPSEHAGIPMRCATRPLLEWTLQRLVAEIPKVSFRQDTKVERWILKDGIVTGLKVEGPDGPAEVAADFVVDASGRGSSTPKWLTDDGFGQAEETVIDAGFGYATGRFRLADPSKTEGKLLMICNAQAPDWPVLAVIIGLPDGTVHACQIAPPGMHPSLEIDQFIEGFRRCGGKHIYEALQGAEVIEPPAPFKNTANRWRHYERMTKWPGRFVAVGDTACTLNPRFGQGMTVASMGAKSLGEWFDQKGFAALDADPVGFSLKFQKRLCKSMNVAWMIATSDDRNFMADVPKGLSDRIAGWYFKQLMTLSTHDMSVYVQFLKVAQLLDPPTKLFTPGMVFQALRQGLRGDPKHQVTAAPA